MGSSGRLRMLHRWLTGVYGLGLGGEGGGGGQWVLGGVLGGFPFLSSPGMHQGAARHY